MLSKENSYKRNDFCQPDRKSGQSFLIGYFTVMDTSLIRKFDCNKPDFLERQEQYTSYKIFISEDQRAYRTYYFIRACVIPSAFDRDAFAVSVLKKYLYSIDSKSFHFFGGSKYRFRGEEIFDRLLELSQNYQRIEEGIDQGSCHGTKPFERLKEMIKTINGFSVNDFLKDNYERVYEYDPNICSGCNGLFIESKPILKALNKGEVVLKAYGEG